MGVRYDSIGINYAELRNLIPVWRRRYRTHSAARDLNTGDWQRHHAALLAADDNDAGHRLVMSP